MTKAELQKLNPDAFSRFQVICNEIKAAYGSKHIKVLDIGGASTFMYDFLRANNIDFELTIVDIIDYPDKPKKAKLIIQSAEKLSFKDNYFDVVTGVDMLEHIPSEKMKKNIISEAIRVSGGLIIFAGPCQTEQVTAYETLLNNENKLLFGVDQKWLAEHFEYGKPTKDLLNLCFKQARINPLCFSVLPLTDWYVSSIANLVPAVSESSSDTEMRNLNVEYNKHFMDGNYRISDDGHAEEGYRTFFIGSKLKSTSRDDSPNPSDANNIETYVDYMMHTIHGTKNYAKLKKDLGWYKKEHARLITENITLQQTNIELIKNITQPKRGFSMIRPHRRSKRTK